VKRPPHSTASLTISAACLTGAAILSSTAGAHHLGGDTALLVSGVILVLLGLAMLATWRTAEKRFRFWRTTRSRHGHYTKKETAEGAQHMLKQRSWDTARALADGLASGQTPTPRTIWGLNLNPGEQAQLDLHVRYARLHSQAPADIAWPEVRSVRVIATDQRLMCELGGRWLSFCYSAATACYPEPAKWSVTFDFSEAQRYQPSLLAVHGVWAIQGAEALLAHPTLAALRSDAPTRVSLDRMLATSLQLRPSTSCAD
jgi:hypothetical protein